MGYTVTELFNLENNYIITKSAFLASKAVYKVNIKNWPNYNTVYGLH